MDKIVLVGKIKFDVDNKTKKHNVQASWKRVAMIMFDDDTATYYAWFIKKRFNLTLNKPLRGAHISFINDSIQDLTLNGKRSLDEVNTLWEKVKEKWNGQEIPVMLELKPSFDKKHWWLNVPHEYQDTIMGIRNELGLGRPYFGLHLSLGYANEKQISHHEYITTLIRKGFIQK